MAQIVFTLRELKNAWRQTYLAFETASNKTNAHRLLLFYAVETGLKAVLLDREGKQISKDQFSEFQHDLNKLMDYLKTGKEYRLDSKIYLSDLRCLTSRKEGQGDSANCGELNQVWRYGAKAKIPTDEELETKLLAIHEWIAGELR